MAISPYFMCHIEQQAYAIYHKGIHFKIGGGGGGGCTNPCFISEKGFTKSILRFVHEFNSLTHGMIMCQLATGASFGS